MVALEPRNNKKAPSFLQNFDHPDRVSERKKRTANSIFKLRVIPICTILKKHAVDYKIAEIIYRFIPFPTPPSLVRNANSQTILSLDTVSSDSDDWDLV